MNTADLRQKANTLQELGTNWIFVPIHELCEVLDAADKCDKWAAAWDRLREALTTIIALYPDTRAADIAAEALAGGKDDDTHSH